MANDPIDEAFVEIKPDLKDFDRDVKRGLDKSFDRIESKLDDVVDVIERQFGLLIDTLTLHFEALEDKADRSFEQMEDSARDAAKSIATDIKIGTAVAKHEIDDLADSADHDFNRIERKARGSGFSIGKMFSSIGKSVGNMFLGIVESVSNIGSKLSSSLGSTIGQVGSSLGTVTGSIGGILQISAMGIAIPLILGLAGAVSQLVGILAALPAAAGVAVAAIAPLIFAFHGFTDAIGAVLEGDPEKINEALKKLSPSAAKVVKEFQKLVKPFSDIQKITQEALFKPLVGELTELANAVLPSLRQGLPLVANAFGNMFKFISEAFSNGEFAGVLQNTFATTARIIEGLTPELGRFAELFISLWQEGLPFVERFFGVMTKGFAVFNDWLEKSIDGDKVVGWLDRAWHVAGQLWEIIKQLSIYVGTLLGSFADEGTDTLDGIAKSLQKANEYLKSDEGAETLHNLGVIVHWAGNAFVFLLGTISTAWKVLNGFFSFIRGIGPFFASVGTWIADAWNSAVEWTKSAWHTIQDWVVNTWNSIINWFTSTGTGIGTWFANLWNGMVTSIRNFVNGSISAIQAFPGALKQFIVDAIHWVAYSTGFAIALLVRFFTVDIPNAVQTGFTWIVDRISAGLAAVVNLFTVIIPALAANVWHWLQDMWTNVETATRNGVHAVIDWASRLPGVVSGFFTDLYNRTVNIVRNTWNSVVNYFRNLVNDAVAEARKLPGLVTEAWNSLMGRATELGKDIVRGIVHGINSLKGWLIDTAKSLAHDAWQGAKDAIGANSPSKEFAKLGKWSAQGFGLGFEQHDTEGEIGKSMTSSLDAWRRQPPGGESAGEANVSVGGAQIVAYLQIGDDQLHPVVVRAMYDNSQDVALAAQQGDTQLARRR